MLEGSAQYLYCPELTQIRICWSHSSGLGVTASSALMTFGTTKALTFHKRSISFFTFWYFSGSLCFFILLLQLFEITTAFFLFSVDLNHVELVSCNLFVQLDLALESNIYSILSKASQHLFTFSHKVKMEIPFLY